MSISKEPLIKVAVADDHKIFRDGIKLTLKDKENIKIIWEADNGKDLLHKISIKKPDVLLMDIRMPEMDGINAIEVLRKEYSDIRIVVLSMYDDQKMINKMMEFGANAFLTKTTDPDEIYEAIRTCMDSDYYFNKLVNNAVMSDLLHKRKRRRNLDDDLPITFSEKEVRIMQLLGEDKTTNEISKIVYLSPRTIETIRQNMKSKVGAKTIGGLLVYGMRHKIIE